MTVASELNRKSFAGDDVTVAFPTTPVVFFDEGDLDVYVVVTATGVATLQTLTTHYTVSGGVGAVGTVTMLTAPTSLQTLVIVRTLDILQEVDFVQNDTSDAEVAEDAIDRLTMISQQLDTKVERSFKLPDGDISGASTELPIPEASKVIGWNDDASALQNYSAADIDVSLVTPFMETVLDDASAAAARTTLGAVGLTGNETIAGAKTFSDNVTISKSAATFGIDGTGASPFSEFQLKRAGTAKWGIVNEGTVADDFVINSAAVAAVLRIAQATGAVTFGGTAINMTTSGTTLTVGVGADNGTVSAGIFTDRTKAYEGDAVAELQAVAVDRGEIKHDTLPAFAQAQVKRPIMGDAEQVVTNEDGTETTLRSRVQVGEELVIERDLGAMISMLTTAVKQLNDRLSALESK